MTQQKETYLSTTELAQRWASSAATIRNLRFKGKGPAYFKPFGDRGKALYKLSDIEAWERENTYREGIAEKDREP